MADENGKSGDFYLIDSTTPPVKAAPTGAELLDRIASKVRSYVSMTPVQADLLALWVVAAHLHKDFRIFPLLLVTSAAKRCGKSRLLEILRYLLPNALPTSSTSAAALFRVIDGLKRENRYPSILLDETDAIFGKNQKNVSEGAEAIRAILDAAHRSDGFVTRCAAQGRGWTVQKFSAFCPIVIAAIGKLPDTVEDRSIPIRLIRRKPTEPISRLTRREFPALNALGEDAERWAKGIFDAATARHLYDSGVDLPENLSDRDRDNVEPLMVVAKLVGGGWIERLKAASDAVLVGRESDDAAGVELLRDLRQVFDGWTSKEIPTKDLVDSLEALDDRPWGTWNRGKPVSPHQVARLLREFGVRPVKLSGTIGERGYKRADLEDSWARYLPAPPPPANRSGCVKTAPEGQQDVFTAPDTYPEAGGIIDDPEERDAIQDEGWMEY